MNLCKRCGICLAHDEECANRGWCELVAARRADATEEDQLIADAIAELSRLDDVRRSRDAG